MVRPAWVFCISKTQESTEDDGTSFEEKLYEHFVYDAVTGERILTAQ